MSSARPSSARSIPSWISAWLISNSGSSGSTRSEKGSRTGSARSPGSPGSSSLDDHRVRAAVGYVGQTGFDRALSVAYQAVPAVNLTHLSSSFPVWGAALGVIAKGVAIVGYPLVGVVHPAGPAGKASGYWSWPASSLCSACWPARVSFSERARTQGRSYSSRLSAASWST